MRAVDVFAVHSGAGGGEERAGEGPTALRRAGLLDWLADLDVDASWHDIGGDLAHLASEPKPRIDYATRLCGTLAGALEASVAAGRVSLTLGGDHSCSIGTWSGIANAASGDVGLVWIDAHMDSHTPETSPSGNLHGMPLAHLLGRGAPSLTGLARRGPALKPGNLVLLGARSFEAAEPRLLDELGVRVYWMPEIEARGFAAVMDEAMAAVRARTALHGISIDLDGLDPEDVSGIGLPVAGGIRGDDLIASLQGAARDPKFAGAEIAEFVPALDSNGQTLALIRRMIVSIFS